MIRSILILVVLGISGSSIGLAQTHLQFPERSFMGADPAKFSTPNKQGSLLGNLSSYEKRVLTGEAAYSYKIPVPKWRYLCGGLSLSYKSSYGNYFAGQGFRLTIPYIARNQSKGVANKNSEFFHSETGVLSYWKGDFYRARLDKNFGRFQLTGNTFKMEDGKGLTYIFGKDASSREESGDYTFRWWLSEVVDAFGNKQVYSYELEENIAYINKIEMIDAVRGSIYQYKIQWESRPRKFETYHSGLKQVYQRRISKILVFKGNESSPFQQTLLTYARNSSRSLLKRIQTFGQNEAYPAVQFQYSEVSKFRPKAYVEDRFENSEPAFYPNMFHLVDFNGDGLIDIYSTSGAGYGFENMKRQLWLNMGPDKGFKSLPVEKEYPIGFYGYKFAEINGDGLMDILDYNTENSYLQVRFGVSESRNSFRWLNEPRKIPNLATGTANDPPLSHLVDFNADGKTDALTVAYPGYQFQINLSDVSKENLTFKDREKPTDERQLINMSTMDLWADFNHDGLLDPCTITRSIEEDRGLIIKHFLNSGSMDFGEVKITKINTNSAYNRMPKVIDLDNDGIVELVFSDRDGRVDIYKEGINEYNLYHSINLKDYTSVEEFYIIEVGDVDGDNALDIIYLANPTSTLKYVTLREHDLVKTPYLMTSYTTDLGERTEFSYSSLASMYTFEEGESTTPFNKDIVTGIRQFAPTLSTSGQVKTKATYLSKIRYKNPAFSMRDREFLGFGEVVKTQWHAESEDEGNIERTQYYTVEQGSMLRYTPKVREFLDFKDNFIYKRISTPHKSLKLFSDSNIYHPLTLSKKIEIFEKDGTSRKTSEEYCTEFYADTMTPAEIRRKMMLGNGEVYRELYTRYFAPRDQAWMSGITSEEHLIDPSFEGESGKAILGFKYRYIGKSTKPESIQRLGLNGWQEPFKRYEYDGSGNPVAVINAEGHRTELRYGDAGAGYLATEVVKASDDTGATLVDRYQYNLKAGEKISAHLSPSGKDNWDLATRYEWDGIGRLKAVKPPGSKRDSHRFVYHWGNSSSLSRVESYRYGVDSPSVQYIDGILRSVGSMVPSENGYIATDFKSYGSAGQVLASINRMPTSGSQIPVWSRDYVTDIEYDAQLRVISQSTPMRVLGKGSYRAVGFSRQVEEGTAVNSYSANSILNYNLEGEPRLTLLDPLGRTCAIEEWLGDKKSLPVINQNIGCRSGSQKAIPHTGEKSRVEFGYDVADRIISVNIDGRPTRFYNYDILGRKTRFKADDLGEVRWLYHNDDQLAAKQMFDQKGVPISTMLYRYDSLNREVERRSLLGGAITYADFGAADQEFRFFYDNPAPGTNNTLATNLLGKPSGLKLFAGAVYGYGYDVRGNKTSEHLQMFNDRFTTQFEYDLADRLITLHYPDKSTINHRYSTRSGVLTSIDGAINATVGYNQLLDPTRYDVSDGKADGVALGITERFNLITGLLESQSVNSGQTTASYQYTEYDTMSRLGNFSGSDSIANDISKIFRYDSRGQIISADLAITPLTGQSKSSIGTYQYSTTGDLTKIFSQNLVPQYNTKGALSSIKKAKDTYEFGPFGRLTHSTKHKKVNWNAEGQIACLTMNSGDQSRFTYTPDLNRFTEVKSSLQGEEKSKVFINQYVHHEKESGTSTYYYYIGGRRVARRIDKKPIDYFVTDHLSSTRMMLSSKDGKVIHYSDKQPFGEDYFAYTAKSGVSDTPRFNFTGSLYDKESGLHQMQVRNYSAELGRFVSADPLFIASPEVCVERPGECGLYGYAKNSPVKYVDLSGEVAWVPISAGIGAIVGGAISAGFEAYASYDSQKGVNWVKTGSAFVGGAIAGAGIGSGVGLAALAGVGGEVTRQGINNMTGQERGISGKQILFSGVAGGLGGTLAKRVTGDFAGKMFSEAKYFQAASQGATFKSLLHKSYSNLYKNSSVQIPHMIQRESAETMYYKGLSDSFSKAAFKAQATGAISGAASEAVVGSMVNDKLNEKTQ